MKKYGLKSDEMDPRETPSIGSGKQRPICEL